MNIYNREFKEEYLKNESDRNLHLEAFLGNIFRISKNYEEMLGKDLYNFTAKEIIEFYKLMNSTSIETLMTLNSQLYIYTQYALVSGLVTDGLNHYQEIDNEILNSCVNRILFNNKIFTREQLDMVTQNMINPCEKYICFALFEGISGDNWLSDLANLTVENYKGNKVYLPSGKILTVSDKLINLMYESASEQRYWAYSKDGTTKEKKFKEGDNKIIKEMYNSINRTPVRDYRRVQARIAMISKIYGLPGLNSKALLNSGRIDMINDLILKEKIGAREVILKHQKDIEYRYGTITSTTRFILKYKDFLKMPNN